MAFTSTAFNESDNIEELLRRCYGAHEAIRREFSETLDIDFRFIIADNGSTDSSINILERLGASDPNIYAIANHAKEPLKNPIKWAKVQA